MTNEKIACASLLGMTLFGIAIATIDHKFKIFPPETYKGSKSTRLRTDYNIEKPEKQKYKDIRISNNHKIVAVQDKRGQDIDYRKKQDRNRSYVRVQNRDRDAVITVKRRD